VSLGGLANVALACGGAGADQRDGNKKQKDG
jgi:hypothetical protein